MRALPTRSRLIAVAALVAAAIVPAPHDDPPPAHASRLAGISGAGSTTLWIMNLDPSQSAAVASDFFNQNGGSPVSIVQNALAPWAAAEIALDAQPALPNGAYAVVTSSDRDVAVVAESSWFASGGSILTRDARPSDDVVVPLAVKRHDGRTSLLSIQNTDTGMQADVSIDLVREGESTPLTSSSLSVPPGTSRTLDVGKDPSFAVAPPGTVGHFRVRSSVPVAVQHIVDVETSAQGAFAAEGIPSDAASSRLFAPMIHARAGNPAAPAGPPLDSEIALVNPNPADARVRIVYAGTAGACRGQSFAQADFTLAGGTSARVDTAPGAASPGASPSPLPADCTAAATVDVTGGAIVATVVDRLGSISQAAAYAAAGQDEVGTLTGLPLVERAGGADRLTTAIHVMNAAASPVTATLHVRDPLTGAPVGTCTSDCRVVLAAGAGHVFWPPSMDGLSDGLRAAAMVESSGPVAVAVSRASALGSLDMAGYTGVVAPAPGGGMRGARSYTPLALRGGWRPPTPRPTATPTAVVTATATPAVGTATPVGTPTPTPRMPATPTVAAPTVPGPTATLVAPTATAAPPTAMPTAAPPSGVNVSGAARSQVPPAVLNAALADPGRVAGYGRPLDLNKPPGPNNPPRLCLSLVDPGKPYHPLFNGLIFKAGCP